MRETDSFKARERRGDYPQAGVAKVQIFFT